MVQLAHVNKLYLSTTKILMNLEEVAKIEFKSAAGFHPFKRHASVNVQNYLFVSCKFQNCPFQTRGIVGFLQIQVFFPGKRRQYVLSFKRISTTICKAEKNDHYQSFQDVPKNVQSKMKRRKKMAKWHKFKHVLILIGKYS